MRRFNRYVDRLLRQRRPRPFVPTDEEAGALAAAIRLRAARPEDAAPSAEFVAALQDRLARVERGEETATDEPAPRPFHHRRRGLLVGTAAAAASAGLTAAADRLFGGRGRSAGTGARRGGTLEPNDGTWQTVMAAGDLAEGGVAAFDTGTVAGFVMRTAGRVSARSGVCTHQGCRLNIQRVRLACPCHRTFFDLDGTVITSQLPTPPPPLPAIEVRERGGSIEVRVPHATP
ncbi:MAG TPA: Rieske 2Fe-2S domain-containing protein [Streptosporangiaceae bacterium]